MNYQSTVASVCLFFPSIGFTSDFSFMSSGTVHNVGLWSEVNSSKRIGAYGNIFLDSDEFQNGSRVSVCGDGSISGSLGSGTCSAHSGVSSAREAEFDRSGFVIGGNFWLFRFLQAHVGILWAGYTSDISIGETDVLDFSELGLDVGLSLPLSAYIKIVASYETERQETMYGLRMTFN